MNKGRVQRQKHMQLESISFYIKATLNNLRMIVVYSVNSRSKKLLLPRSRQAHHRLVTLKQISLPQEHRTMLSHYIQQQLSQDSLRVACFPNQLCFSYFKLHDLSIPIGYLIIKQTKVMVYHNVLYTPKYYTKMPLNFFRSKWILRERDKEDAKSSRLST